MFVCRLHRLAGALAIAFALAVSGCSKQAHSAGPKRVSDAVPVTVAAVETVPIDRTLNVVGTLFAKSESVVSAQVEGQVEQTLVDFGALVARGQELARIDTASYQALTRQAEANLAKAEANAFNAQQDLKRVEELQKSRISAASELDAANARGLQTKAEVKAAEATLSIANLNLERSHVKAPFDGRIAERIATAGDYVKVGASLYRLVDDAELKFIVQAPERYAGEIEVGQDVRFEVDAWPNQVFQGKVYLISPQVNLASRAFNVGALVANPERKLKASSFGRGEILIKKQVPTPTIPLEAVVNFAGITKVYVIVDGVARSREVKLGRVQQGRQEVLDGVKQGEFVVVTGQTKLYEGARVRVQTATKSSGES